MAHTYKSNPILDNVIVFRMLYLLTVPFKENPLYKAGTIDEKGNYILPKSKRIKPEQRPTYLDKLIINLKKLLNKLPMGENNLKSLLAAMILLKEGIETENPKLLTEDVKLPNVNDVKYINDKISFYKVWKEYVKLKEDAAVSSSAMPANNVSSGHVAMVDTPMNFGAKKRKGFMHRR
jgi:hypothetical protein